jgi:hypothetical protein
MADEQQHQSDANRAGYAGRSTARLQHCEYSPLVLVFREPNRPQRPPAAPAPAVRWIPSNRLGGPRR